MKKGIIGLILLGFVSVVGVVGYSYFRYAGNAVALDEDYYLLVSQNRDIRSIAGELFEKKIISSKKEFLVFSRYFGYDKKVQVGEYKLSPGDSLKAIFLKIVSGKSVTHKLTIPEGYNSLDIAKRLEQKGFGTAKNFLKHCKNKRIIHQMIGSKALSCEGYLFPDTYFFSRLDSELKIMRAMILSFKNQFKNVRIRSGWSQHELVTLASIVEKETGASFERKKISSVFHNRLKKKMRLQTDPTVLYAKWLRTGRWSKNITRKDLKSPHPYNTYKVKGLPPGPIASPGLAALKAANAPEKTNYLFFVSQNDGTHVFSKDYKAHTRAVNRYQKNPRARKGKSWRDLKKKK